MDPSAAIPQQAWDLTIPIPAILLARGTIA